jgi:4-amino-4-deoxy-L-arabinose transferase-like glycosyltransferase
MSDRLPSFTPARVASRILLAIFLVALFFRIGFLQQARTLPTQQQLVMDAARYDSWAREIAGGEWRPREAFSQAPLYPYLMAGIYQATGGSIGALRLFQALAGALTVFWLAIVAGRLFGERAAYPAGVLAALYGPAIFYTPLLLKTTFHLFFEAAVLILLVPRVGSRLRSVRVLAAGLCLGAAALLQENLLILLPLLALWLFRLPEEPVRRRAALAGALAAGTALALIPFVSLSYGASGEIVLTSSQSGMNFYIGNARGATGTYVPLSDGSQDPAHQKADARRLAAALAERATGRPVSPEALSPRRLSAIFWREAGRQIAADPAAWGRLLLRKLQLFWNAYEIPDAEGYDVYRRETGASLWLLYGFGFLAPLAVAGLVAAVRSGDPQRRRNAWSLAVLIAAGCLSVVAFFVFGRYRMVIVPFLFPPAGYAVARLAELARERRFRELASLAGVAVALGILAFVPAWTPDEKGRLEAAIHYNLGVAANRGSIAAFHEVGPAVARSRAEGTQQLLQALALADRAEQELAEALALDPGFFGARLERAWALFRQGGYLAAGGGTSQAVASYAEARGELQKALAAGPGHAPPEAEGEARRLLAAIEGAERTARTRLGGASPP